MIGEEKGSVAISGRSSPKMTGLLKQQDSVFQLIEVIFEIIELGFVKVGFWG